jgi:hypothetical protein
MNIDKATPELYAALSAAQGEIQNATKSSTNPHFKSKYADLAEVLTTIRETFPKHGLSLTQAPSFDGSLAHVTTLVAHSGGGSVMSIASCSPAKTDAQGIGAATTYLRRYSASAMAGIAQEDDDGNAAAHDRKPLDRPKSYDEMTPEERQAEQKRAHDVAVIANGSSVTAIKQAIADWDESQDQKDLYRVAECWRELSQDTQRALWIAPTKGGVWTVHERDVLKNHLPKEAA